MQWKHAIYSAIALVLLAMLAVLQTNGSSQSAAFAGTGDIVRTTAFLPSVYGFEFRNPRPKPSDSRLARLTSGRCGGMSYAAIDNFQAGVETAESAVGDEFLVKRSADSIVANGARFALWSVWPNVARSPLEGGVGTLTRTEELGRLSNALEDGPVPLGLVRAKGLREIGRNHQVVAFSLKRTGDRVVIGIYDSCQPGADDVTLRLRLDHPGGLVREYAGDTVVAEWRGLFVERYTPTDPPAK